MKNLVLVFAVLFNFSNLHAQQTDTIPDLSLKLKSVTVHLPYNTIEASVQWVVNKHLTVAPGFEFGVDHRDETPQYGLGCLFLFE